jgi:hypothetical protein
MITKLHPTLVFLAGMTLFLASCSKEKNPYEPFAGTWQVAKLEQRTTDPQNNLISDTTFINLGTINLILDPEEKEDSRFNLFEFTTELFELQALKYLYSKNAVYQAGGKNWVQWYTDFDYKRLFVWGTAPFTHYVQVYTIQEDKIGDKLTLYMMSEVSNTMVYEVVEIVRK